MSWAFSVAPGVTAGPELPPLVVEALREIGGASSVRQSQNLTQTQQRFESVYAQMRRERIEAIDYAAEFAQLASGDTQHIRRLDAGGRRTA